MSLTIEVFKTELLPLLNNIKNLIDIEYDGNRIEIIIHRTKKNKGCENDAYKPFCKKLRTYDDYYDFEYYPSNIGRKKIDRMIIDILTDTL
jgi:hypothetical protein